MKEVRNWHSWASEACPARRSSHFSDIVFRKPGVAHPSGLQESKEAGPVFSMCIHFFVCEWRMCVCMCVSEWCMHGCVWENDACVDGYVSEWCMHGCVWVNDTCMDVCERMAHACVWVNDACMGMWENDACMGVCEWCMHGSGWVNGACMHVEVRSIFRISQFSPTTEVLGSRDQTQVIRLSGMCVHGLSHLVVPFGYYRHWFIPRLCSLLETAEFCTL